MTERKPTFTFIMPCYNAEKSIRQSLKSLLSVNYPRDKFSVIIVDDGSTDQTIATINKYQSDKVQLIRLKKNKGPANARNVGKNRVSTDYIVFIDTETLVDKNILLHHAATVGKFPQAVFSGNIKFFGHKNLNTEIAEKGEIFSMKAGPNSDLLWAATNNLCVPKKIYRHYSFNPRFSTAAAEDIDFCFRIRKEKFRILFNAKAVAYHRSFDRFITAVAREFRYGQGTGTLIKTHPDKSIFSWRLLGRFLLLISFIIAVFLAFWLRKWWFLFWPLFHFIFSSYYLFTVCFTDQKIYEKGLLFSILTSIYKSLMIWVYEIGVIIGNLKNKNPLFSNIDPQYMLEGGNSRLSLIWFLEDVFIAGFYWFLMK